MARAVFLLLLHAQDSSPSKVASLCQGAEGRAATRTTDGSPDGAGRGHPAHDPGAAAAAAGCSGGRPRAALGRPRRRRGAALGRRAHLC